MVGTCRLCLKKKQLIKKSHIISDFMYKPVLDQDHSMIKLNMADTVPPKAVYTGDYESKILCDNCDNQLLGSLESYASKVLFGFPRSDKDIYPLKTENQLHPDGKLTSTFVEGLDYRRFKLFLLSILWRASITERPFFNQVTLGPKEEEVRKMLLYNNPGNYMDYPCLISSFVNNDKKITEKIITSPRRLRSHTGIRYIFHIGQLVYLFFVSPNDTPRFLADAVINAEGKMRIIHLTDDAAEKIKKGLFQNTPLENLL